ncbi:uncharacterized protein LOC124133993 isoform X1 [Haliotis rufescens]|uniref:uncharacterized protein LOC124133993 isoform X1 n=1 Tax=Haliotis rufescens TaxID=6454 RepID=UPI00201F46E7|nr:uncharacterized protein LOC124133993 isoform X1 [Haliotis rufescens]
MKELEMEASFYDLDIVDNEGAGNCMFIALVQQLQIHDIDIISHKHLREKVVQYVQGKRCLFKDFVDKNHYPTFRDYIIKMKMLGEWGDNIILQATADLYKRKRRKQLMTPKWTQKMNQIQIPSMQSTLLYGNTSEEQLQRHDEFVSGFPTPDRRVNFAEGYLSQYMQQKMLQYLISALTLTRLKDTRAATDYLMYVGVKEAIIHILMDVLNKPYEEVN